MMRKHVERSIAIVAITLYVLVMFGEGYAADPDVMLVVNPKSTEVQAGSGKIVITVEASGENLTFTWQLKGPGKLEDEGAAAFYSPPEKIDQESASAIVTVTVKEPSGQETVKSVTFTILPSPPKTATPSPEPTPTEKKGMSMGTKVALGAGAVVALGGGIALMAGGGGGGGSNGDSATYSIVGLWNHEQRSLDENIYGSGSLSFDGSSTSGTYLRLDSVTAQTFQGTYTVDGISVSMSESSQEWTGGFESSEVMRGIWNHTVHSDTAGTWTAWKQYQ